MPTPLHPASILAFAALMLSACSGGHVHIVASTSVAAKPRATSITLTWLDQSAGEAGFSIERDDGNGQGNLHDIGRVSANTTRFEDTGLSPATLYRYQIVTLGNDTRIVSAIVFVATGLPALHRVTPDSGFMPGGSTVTLHGDGFSAGVESALFGGTTVAEFTVQDDATVTCVVPPSTVPGVVAIDLETPSGTLRLPNEFVYHEWPPTFGIERTIDVGSNAVPIGAQFKQVDGYLYALWAYDRASIWFARSTDDGRQWETAVRIDSGQGEPRFPRLAADGRGVFVVWEDDRVVTMNTSTNRGGSWVGETSLNHPTAPACFPNVHASGTTVHVTWSDHRQGHGQLYYDRSTDSGATWQSQLTRLNPGSRDARHVQIAGTGDRIYLLWWSEGKAIYFNRSKDGGVTWLAKEIALGLSPRQEAAAPPRIRCAGDNVWVVCEEAASIAIIRSTNAGDQWSEKQILDSYLGYSYRPEIAISGKNVYVVWYDGAAFARAAVSANRSTDGGKTWLRKATTVRHATSTTPVAPRLCCDGDRVIVVWASSDSLNGTTVYLQVSDNAGQWWQRVVRPLSKTLGAEQPRVTCNGGRVTVLWRQFEHAMQRYGFRAVTNGRF